jgi:hypothetical protein
MDRILGGVGVGCEELQEQTEEYSAGEEPPAEVAQVGK